MKTIFKIIRFAIFLIILALVFHNFTAKWGLAIGLRYALGVPVSVESASVDLMGADAEFRGVEIGQPQGFPKGVMIYAPKILVDLQLSSFFEKKIHVDEIEIDVAELNVVRTPDRRINILNLKMFNEDQKSGGGASRPQDRGTSPKDIFQLDRLTLSLKNITYDDLSIPVGQPRRIPVGIDRASYKNINSFSGIFEVLSWESLKALGLGSFKAGLESILEKPKGFLEKLFG